MSESMVKTGFALLVLSAGLLAALPARGQDGDNVSRISLEQALDLAARRNPDLRGAILEVSRAGQQVRAEEGLYPWVMQLDGGYTHNSSPSLAADGSVSHRVSDRVSGGAEVRKTMPVGTTAAVRVQGDRFHADQAAAGTTAGGSGTGHELAARLLLTQPLLRGAGRRPVEASLRQARISEDVTRMRQRRQASELVRTVAVNYWQLWYAEQVEAIQRQTRELARERLRESEERVAVGDAAPVDALPFVTRLAELEEAVIAAASRRRQIALELSRMLGDPEGGTLPATVGSPPEQAMVVDPAVAVRAAVESSPEVLERAASLALSRERITVAGEEQRPRLDLQGWIEARTMGSDGGSPMMGQLAEGEAYSAFVGLVYEMPLDGTRRDAARAVAGVGADIDEQSLLSARDSVRAEVLKAVDDLEAARSRLELAERILEAAARQAEAASERHRLGIAVPMEVRLAEDSLRDAGLRKAQLLLDAALAEVRLRHLTGELAASL